MSEKSNAISRESSLRRKKANSIYHYRRRSKALFTEQYSGELKHVLGFTLKSNCAFACDPNSGLLAYPAGCVIVLYDPRQEKQQHIFNPGQKNLTCLKFSTDGNFIVTGEAGHQPCVRIFSVAERCQVVSFLSHKFGISSVAFSPNGKYVVSIGYQHDNVINVWDWKKDKLAASNKVSTKIKNVAFSEDSSYFVTVGNRHVKFWYLENSTVDKVTVPLKGRSAILETLRNHVFCDVLCGIGSNSKFTFAISRSGMLCQFNGQRTVEKYIELSCGTARSMCLIDEMILCGCASGSVHVFHSNTLEFITEIFTPKLVRDHEIVAITIDMRNMWMHCVFSNHSLLVFDVMEFSSPQTHSLFQFHSSCVWDVKVIPSAIDSTSVFRNCFLTCSNDGTTRAWHIEDHKCQLIKIFKLDQPLDGVSEDPPSKYEARSLCVRCDGKHLAVGDRTGNIHIYDLEKHEKLAFIPVHEGDILCLDYSKAGDMLASASRDRCVHAFDSSYHPTHTVADHSAAVTSAKFAHRDADFRLVTCGSDKSLYFCAVANNSGKTEITREQHFVEKHSMSDMAVLDDTVLVACGNNLIEYDVIGGKLKRSFKGNDFASTILRVAVNHQKTVLATSCADKQICVLNFITTECLCVMGGHSEIATALTFDNEDRLLSASADGCVFVWVLRHRSIEDVRNSHVIPIHQPSSAVSTPGSPDLDRTAYFAEALHHSLACEPEDDVNTPRPSNGEPPTVWRSSFDDEPELPPPPPVVAPAAAIPPLTDNNLPTWVIKNLHNEVDPGTKHISKPVLGKWGNTLELEKVCEEIGNLSPRSDSRSSVSSFEEEGVLTSQESHSQQAPSNDVVTSSDAAAACDSNEDSKPAVQELSSVDVTCDASATMRLSEAAGTTESAADNPEEPVKLNDIESQTGDDVKDEVPSKYEKTPELIVTEDENDDHLPSADDVERLSKKYLRPDEIGDDFKTEKTNCLSLQDELQKAQSVVPNCQSPSKETADETQDCAAELNKTYAVTQPSFVVEKEEITNSVKPNVIEPLPSATTPVEEDIDIRRVIYLKSHQSPDNEHKQDFLAINDQTFVTESCETNPSNKKEDDEHISTPTTHLTSGPSSRTIFPSFSTQLRDAKATEDSLQAAEITRHSDAEAEQAFDEVSRNLVDSVLASVDNGSDRSTEAGTTCVACNGETRSSDCAENLIDLNPSDEKHEAVEEKATENVDTTPSNMQQNCEVPDVPEISHDEKQSAPNFMNTTVINDSADTITTSLSTTDKTLTSTSNTNSPQSAPQPSLDRKESDRNTSMPPAFAELLASLAKKRNSRVHPSSAPKSLPLKRQHQMNDSNVRGSERSPPNAQECLHESYDSRMHDEVGKASYPIENGDSNRYSSRVNDNSFDSWHENQIECQRASEELLATFNRAEAVYHKQRARSEEDVANGNHSGFQRLIRSFQTIHNRIGGLRITNAVYPEETPLSSRSVSLENITDDSPVYSLLREYSDRLVGLVNTQADRGNILSTQADTV